MPARGTWRNLRYNTFLPHPLASEPQSPRPGPYMAAVCDICGKVLRSASAEAMAALEDLLGGRAPLRALGLRYPD